MTSLRTLDDLLGLDLHGQAVFVRADLNVPLDGSRVLDDTRVRATVPTLQRLAKAGARTLVFSHLGRPKGERRPELSLRPVAPVLASLLGTEVAFADDCIGEAAHSTAAGTPPGGVALFENLRFHAGEKTNDDDFADALASLAHAYVDDAFGCAHRAHASIVGVPRRTARSAAGLLLEREVAALGRLLQEPPRPFVAILGGAKIAGKIATLENLLPRLQGLLIGGAMANTFLAAQGADMGASLVAEDELGLARRILGDAEARGIEVLLPTDLVVTDRLAADDDQGPAPEIREVAARSVPAGFLAVDIGPRSTAAFEQAIAAAGTVFWNGPAGLFERAPFDAASQRLALALAESPAYTVVGGGETVAVVQHAGVTSRIDHVSTGGGASLSLLAGNPLPGVAVLDEEPK
jgi:phosphoglycerate kinase